MAAARPNEAKVRIAADVPEYLVAALDRYAEEQDRSRSYVVAQAIREFLETRDRLEGN